VIALATAVAWLWVCARAWRRRAYGELVLLAAPLGALLGCLHFVIAYPLDNQGVIKGYYMQFASAPLVGLFGLAVDEMWRQRGARRALAVLLLAAVAPVALYTLYCRLS
jgi:hypothetical protein